MGLTNIDDLVDAMASEPDAVWLCIDEHSENVEGHGVLCAHTGCGAAAGGHGLGKDISTFAVIVRDLSPDKQETFKTEANQYLSVLGGTLTLEFFFE